MKLNLLFHFKRGLRMFIFLLIWGILVAIPTGIIIYPFSFIVTMGLVQQGNVAALSGVSFAIFIISIPLYCIFLSIMLKYVPFYGTFKRDTEEARRERGVIMRTA